MGRAVEGPAVFLFVTTPLKERFVIPSAAEESYFLVWPPSFDDGTSAPH